MFTVTVVNLAPDARTVVEGGGAVKLGIMSAAELLALLDAFVELDAVENIRADPEIRIQSTRERFVVRTGQRKLFLQDARKLSEPAYALTAAEILAEIDGSAAARRSAAAATLPPWSGGPPAEQDGSPGAEIAPGDLVPSRPWPFALIGLVLLLGGYSAYARWDASPSRDQPVLTPLTSAERLAEDSSLTGVYTTGSEPGQHGIIIMGDGRLRLFRFFGQTAPGVVNGTYRFGRLDSILHLATDQPGGLIRVQDRETLEFCAEIYRRVP